MKRARSWLTMAAMLAAGLVPLASGSALTARAAPSSPRMSLGEMTSIGAFLSSAETCLAATTAAVTSAP